MRGAELIGRMRTHHKLAESARLGLIGSTKADVTVDERNRDLLVMATTDDVDLDREVVVPGGADLSYWNANRRVFVDHRYDFASHVAVMRSTIPFPSKEAQRGWMVRIHLLSGLKNPMADDILTVARESGLGVSIGFEAVEITQPVDTDPPLYRKAQTIVRKWRWIELSFTALPCNVACQTQRESGDEKGAGMLEELLTKGRIKRESALALGWSERKAPRRVVVVAA